MNPSYRAAMVAPIKRQSCTGMSGRQCTCGLWHAPGGVTVDRGLQSDHKELPVTFAGAEPQDDFHPLTAAICWAIKPTLVVALIAIAGLAIYYR